MCEIDHIDWRSQLYSRLAIELHNHRSTAEPLAKHEANHTYPNDQRAATRWYHDHSMGTTGRNIYMGMAGFYLIEDEERRSLRLPDGRYDIPLMLCIRDFKADGSFKYDSHGHQGAGGDVTLVNGAVRPFLRVERRRYRFRILNASNADGMTLALSSGLPFVQIATDGGLMSQSVELAAIPLAMAERVEVAIDFADYGDGDSVVLRNIERDGVTADIMRFDVRGPTVRDPSEIPQRLSTIESLMPELASRTRTFTFGARPELGLRLVPVRWTINGARFDAERAQADPRLGDVEIWRFIHGPFQRRPLHPPHIHLVNFQLLDRNGRPPHAHEPGWKDTVRLAGGDDVRVIMRFDGYRGRYLLHCHNLEHEDHHMMMRFDVV